MRINIQTKIILIIFLIEFIAVFAMTNITVGSFSHKYSEEFNSETVLISKDLGYKLDKILNLGIPLHDIIGFEKQCKEIVEKNTHLNYAMVVDERGNILFHNDPVFIGKKINDPDLLDSIDNEEEKTIVSSSEEGKIFNSVIPVLNSDGKHIASVIIGTPTKIVETKLQKLSNNLFLIIAISTLICIILLIFSLRLWVTQPITKLRNITKEIEDGNLNIKMGKYSNDEVGDLAVSVENMTKYLLKSRKKFQNYSKKLEKKVNERTQEINDKIKESEDVKNATLNILEDVDETNKNLIKTREQLKDKIKELKVMDKKKDEFISVTAHELKTPLTSIRGFTEILKNESVMNDKEKRNKFFNIIIQDTQRLEKLITDILDLTRLDLGTLKFNIEQVSIEQIFQDLINLSQISISEKGIKSFFKVKGKIPGIYTDKERVIQVLSNLITNSIKYTEKGCIKIEAFRSGRYVQFSVSDTGVGIPESEHKRIFKRFYQVDSSITRKYGGSGLGLAICKGIVESLGGKIWVESTVGKGSAFYFTLPIEKKKTKKNYNMKL